MQNFRANGPEMARFQLKTAISRSTAQEQKFRQNFTISGPKRADGPDMARFQLKTAISRSTAQEQKFRLNFTISGPKRADGPETARFQLKTAISRSTAQEQTAEFHHFGPQKTRNAPFLVKPFLGLQHNGRNSGQI